MSSEARPLVHVFLVQESAKIDALQSVSRASTRRACTDLTVSRCLSLQIIESLSQTVPSMHPDIKVVLLTFSNRIGVYRLAPAFTYVIPTSS